MIKSYSKSLNLLLVCFIVLYNIFFFFFKTARICTLLELRLSAPALAFHRPLSPTIYTHYFPIIMLIDDVLVMGGPRPKRHLRFRKRKSPDRAKYVSFRPGAWWLHWWTWIGCGTRTTISSICR